MFFIFPFLPDLWCFFFFRFSFFLPLVFLDCVSFCCLFYHAGNRLFFIHAFYIISNSSWVCVVFVAFPFRNDRASYVKNWWTVVNWQFAAERYAEVRQARRRFIHPTTINEDQLGEIRIDANPDFFLAWYCLGLNSKFKNAHCGQQNSLMYTKIFTSLAFFSMCAVFPFFPLGFALDSGLTQDYLGPSR